LKDLYDILLFVSRESATYHFTRRQVEGACAHVFGETWKVNLKVIDIEEQPELAERHNIEALPTLIVSGKRFVGTPTQEMLSTCMGLVPPSEGR
ncbi:circadian clock KaiB family protein, partial [Patescibacteria group bacterium]